MGAWGLRCSGAGPGLTRACGRGGDAGNRPAAEEVGAQRPLWAQVLLWPLHCVASRSLQLKNRVEGGGWLAASWQGAWPSGPSPAAREVLLTRRFCASSLKAAGAAGRLGSALGPLKSLRSDESASVGATGIPRRGHRSQHERPSASRGSPPAHSLRGSALSRSPASTPSSLSVVNKRNQSKLSLKPLLLLFTPITTPVCARQMPSEHFKLSTMSVK